jgi:hypothetical protein
MFSAWDKSGAEVTAVQTLREFRRRLNFAKRRGVRQPSGALRAENLRDFRMNFDHQISNDLL